MNRRNFLGGILSTISVAPVWDKFQTAETNNEPGVDTGSPLVVDRFDKNRVYNEIVVGSSRSGKTCDNTGLNLIHKQLTIV